MQFHELTREEVIQVWDIDRSEVITGIYKTVNGNLALSSEYFEMQGWPPGEADLYTPLLLACYDRGGWFMGLFDEENLVGIVVLDSKFLGTNADLLQLKFLHLSKQYRHRGLGKQLFELARTEAKNRGAKGMYISATPSENTIHFYKHLDCTIAKTPDPELFNLEPEDIHLICRF